MSSPSSYVFAILSKASGILDLLSSNSTKHAPGSLLTTMADTFSIFMGLPICSFMALHNLMSVKVLFSKEVMKVCIS